MTVGERIKNLREKLGMSQVDFADKINVSKQTLYKYENNIITNIPSDKIEAVAAIGNVSPAHLMGWDTNVGPIHNGMKQKKTWRHYQRTWSRSRRNPHRSNRGYYRYRGNNRRNGSHW